MASGLGPLFQVALGGCHLHRAGCRTCRPLLLPGGGERGPGSGHATGPLGQEQAAAIFRALCPSSTRGTKGHQGLKTPFSAGWTSWKWTCGWAPWDGATDRVCAPGSSAALACLEASRAWPGSHVHRGHLPTPWARLQEAWPRWPGALCAPPGGGPLCCHGVSTEPGSQSSAVTFHQLSCRRSPYA